MQHELELLGDLSNETIDSAARKSRKIGIEQGLELGVEKGRKEAAFEFAYWLVQRGYSDEEIQKVTKLSPDEISKIKNGT